MPGQAPGLRETDKLIRNLPAGHLLANWTFDADGFQNDLPERAIILSYHRDAIGSFPQHSTRKPENGAT
ncbi:MAG: hypothetical protein Q4P24_16410 [Rhodobacterales bacterium]|nr:hypothetical protein [Rhodobacterales bacterium]